MQHPSYAKAPKPVEYRLGELVQSLLVIRDSLQLLQVGHGHQVLPIGGQLRALLTDRTTKPLLYAVAESIGAELQVWTEGGLRGKRGPDQESPLLFGMQGMHLTASQSMAGQIEVPLSEALDTVVLHAESTNFTARDIIDFLANQAGGAHFAEHLPSTLASVMATVELGSLPAPFTAVAQFGQAALDLGRQILRELTEVDFDLVMTIRKPRPEGPAFLFDARCTGSDMRYFGQVSPNLALTFGVSGVGGRFAASAQNVTDWSQPHHVRFTHQLRDDLSSELRVEVDGNVRLEITPGRPILAFSNPDTYEIRFNGGFDEPDASCEWGLGDFGMSPPQAGYDLAMALLAHRDTVREKNAYRCMTRDQFLMKPVGSDELTGNVQEIDWRTWQSSADH